MFNFASLIDASNWIIKAYVQLIFLKPIFYNMKKEEAEVAIKAFISY